MRQTFSTYVHNENSSENDESIVTDFIIIENDREVYIKINKEIMEVVRGGEVEKKKTESIELENIDVQTLTTIRDRVNSWVKSESKATIFETFSSIEGEYVVKNLQKGQNHNLAKRRSSSFDKQKNHSI